MKKCCGECPWKVRNRNNDSFIRHSKKFIKKHNCHMVPSNLTGGVWDIKKEYQCFGNKKFLNHE